MNKSSKREIRPKTPREQTEEMIEMLQVSLSEAPKLKRSDFIVKLEEYKYALEQSEKADKTISKYCTNATWFVLNYTTDEEHLIKDHVMKFKDDIQEKYEKISTINSYITTINRFLYFCELKELKVDKLKGQQDNVLSDRLYEHEVKSMIRKTKQMGKIDLSLMIKIISQTGIRIAEREFITVEACERFEIRAKNKGKTRSVPLPQELSRELRKHAKSKGISNGLVIDMEYLTIYNGLKEVAGICKIKKAKVYPHAFRHYFAFRYVEKGGNIAQLADILGHTDLKTTSVYTRGTLADYRKQLEEM